MSEQLQQEEWEVLQAIYADYVSRDLSDGFITLEVPIELPEPKNVTGGDEDTFTPGSLSYSSRNSATSILLSSLPPIILDIRLPASYPLTTPPEVVSIHATHSWLPSTSKLQQLLSDMWSPAEGVLCAWVEFICSGEFLESLEYTSSLRLERCIRIPHPDLILLMPSLVAYDTSFQQSRFSQTSYSCQICLTSIKGAKCILLSCSHVFCRPCMEDFWGLLIKEGNVGKMGCPDPACVEDGREATEDELKRVVSGREVQRWKWLREKQALERDPTMVYCPVAVCQTPVLRSTPVEPGSSWERFRECPNCRFAFCAFCKKAWHGLSECQISQFDTFIEEYESLPEDSPERKAIEDRYGKKMFELLVLRSKARYDAEQVEKMFLERYATPCPGCQTYIEKNRGCNHMQCTLCYQHFCFLCGDKLSEPNVYKHFSIKTIPCYNRLWDQGKFS